MYFKQKYLEIDLQLLETVLEFDSDIRTTQLIKCIAGCFPGGGCGGL